MGAYLSCFKNFLKNFFGTIRKKKSKVYYKEAEEFPESLRQFTKSKSSSDITCPSNTYYCYLPTKSSFQHLPDILNYSLNESWIMNISFSSISPVISRFIFIYVNLNIS